MKKHQPFQTTSQEIDTFLKTEKYIILPNKFVPRSPYDKRYFIIKSDFYDSNDSVIPQWFFQLTAKAMVQGKDDSSLILASDNPFCILCIKSFRLLSITFI